MNLSEHVTLYIQRNTKKGESLADFLLDTMHGRTPYAKFSHQFKAVELLTFYGGFVPDQLPTLDNLPARNDSSGKSAKRSKKHKVTEKELLNYDIIRMIKQDTRNGELLVDLLIHVAIEGKMSNSRRFISPSTRMRAAQELLTRGFGAVAPRRIPTGKNEGLGATISKRIRKDTDNGREAAAYLMDIVIGNPPHTKPSKRKRFTPHRRVLAACELLRRLCDIRTDHITPEHIQAYWTSQTPIDARARETHANSRPDINRTGIDKATALAAMATKPAANDAETQIAAASKPAAKPAANDAADAPKDPFPPRGKARMGASPTTASTETNAAASEPSNTANEANAAKPAKNAEMPAANNAAESSKDPFPPKGKARTEASPTTNDAETQTNATTSAQPKNPFPPRGKARMGASPAADTAQTQANADKPVDKPISAETSAAASKPAISEPPANAGAHDNPHTNASPHKSVDSAAASKPSNNAKPDDTTTPLRPTASALNSSPQKPKLTRQQRRQAQRKQKKAQRRAQRKARSP